MQIIYIRHAESYNNYLYFVQRSAEKFVLDPPLSEVGQQQAAALAEFLKANQDDFNFDHIYISPFLRTLQTAQAFTPLYPDIPKTVSTLLYEEGGCREIYPGDPPVTILSPGLNRAQMEAQFPAYELPEEITADGWYLLPDVEPVSHTLYRANQLVEQLTAQYGETDAKIALVSHGAFHNYFLHALLKRTPCPDLWFRCENTGMTTVEHGFDPGGDRSPDWWRILSVNRHEWLPEELKRDW